jgi:hypothetical protein
MNRAHFPLRTFERLRRQWFQTGGFLFLENLKRSPLRGSVDLHADFLPTPGQRPVVGLVDVTKISARQKLPANYGYYPLHFTFVFWFPHLGRIGNKTIMPLQIGIGPVQRRIVNVGLNHPGLQVIQYNTIGNTEV